MMRYVLQRLIYMFLVLLVIVTATFFLMKLLPGSPLRNSDKLSKTQQEMILKQYGLDEPVLIQYFTYMKNIARGHLGISFQFPNRSVVEVIASRIGPSMQLGLQALILGTFIGIFLGTAAALKHGSFVDYLSTAFAAIGVSVPSFVFAGLLQYQFGVKWDWLPIVYWESFQHTVLPTLALSVFVIASTARFMRTEMLEVMSSDYVRFARSKGLSNFHIVVHHGLRNALTPMVTILGPLTVNLMMGSLVIEKVFAIPGMGEQFVLSIMTNDYPMIMGTTIVYSVLLVVVIFLVDVLYLVLDPRIRISRGNMG